ncbi:uncharacterized protein LOC120188249 [Hibiscus syriacus]|uniref:uncharacterized protein LOC120188249 n=1 Tax=Hibiscus syriacus TaxID=106335 RepID=UPI001923553B|nr:uncharacterized protein LOC120188249 [Hibiscus syriacus]
MGTFWAFVSRLEEFVWGSKDQSLDFFPPELRDGVVTVNPPSEGKPSQVKVSLAGPNLFVFSFLDVGLREWVLENGPWHIQNKPLILRDWTPGMKKLSFDLSLLPIWVQLYNVPLELYSQKGLSYIANALGKPLFMDSITASRQRLEFAKICVEIEAGAIIPEFIQVLLKNGSYVNVRVLVPWFPRCCALCKSFGHLASSCTEARQPPQKPKELQVWRRKDSNTVDFVCNDILTVIPAVTSGTSEVANTSKMSNSVSPPGSANNSEELQINTELRVGKVMETSVLALQEVCEPNLEAIRENDSVDTGALGANQHLLGAVHSGEFPSLQDSLKKKVKGRKKENFGSSSKMEVVVDAPRKVREARVASMGVAALLNEIKSKKKDHLEKAKSSVVNLGIGNCAQQIPA